MKQNFIFLLSFFPILLFSQRRSDCRSSMDFIFSPDYFAPPQEEADASFTPLFSYRTGLNVSIFSSSVPYFVFRSGMRYVRYEYDLKAFFSNQTSRVTKQFVEIPFVFRLYFSLNKLRPYIEAQSSLNMNTGKTVGIHFTAGGAVGLEYVIQKEIALFFQPTFRKPIYHTADARAFNYHFSTGLELGVKYRY